MLQNELIDSTILSFAYHDTDMQTKLTFGEPDYSLALSSSINATIPLLSKGILYYVQIYESQIGGKSIGKDSQ